MTFRVKRLTLKQKKAFILSKPNGFTLVELVVVMAIIAVLATLVTGAISVARKQAKYTEAAVEMRDIRTGFEVYIGKFGELPPIGDDCSACFDPPSEGEWNRAVNAMRDAGIISQEVADKYYFDPWGTPYLYDDNYGQGSATQSLFCTAGPDKRWDSFGRGGDDQCSNIDHGAVACKWGCP